jgi:transcriptional regulator with XRE-family HTH domain
MGRGPAQENEERIRDPKFRERPFYLEAYNLRKYREERGLSHEEIAAQYISEEGKVATAGHISGLESGTKPFGPVPKKKLAKILGISPHDFHRQPSGEDNLSRIDTDGYAKALTDHLDMIVRVMRKDPREGMKEILKGLVHCYAVNVAATRKGDEELLQIIRLTRRKRRHSTKHA